MTLLPAKVLERKLSWTSDFKKKTMTAPGPGQVQISAATISNYGGNQMAVKPVPKSRPTVYKATPPTVTITMDSTSWVASYVLDDWSQQKQDDLLGHEQTHFMITACLGRDFHDELDALGGNEYSSSGDGIADIQAIMTKYAQTVAQGIHDKYDVDTKHNPTGNPVIQKKWTDAVEDARANKKQLMPTLKVAGLIP